MILSGFRRSRFGEPQIRAESGDEDADGGQLVTLGLLAELQARTYHESQDKPTYVVRQILDAPAPWAETAPSLGRDRDVRR